MKKKFLLLLILMIMGWHYPANAGKCPQDSGQTLHDANLRRGPGLDQQVIMVLTKGTIIYPMSQQEQWLQVEAPIQNQSGWLHNTLVGPRACPEDIITLSPLKQKIKKTGPLATMSDQPAPGRVIDQSGGKIAVIDIQQVLNQSIQGKLARDGFNAAKSGHNEIETLQREEEIISRIIMEIRAVAELYAKNHGFSHILNKNSGAVFYSSPRHDITRAITREYDRKIIATENSVGSGE